MEMIINILYYQSPVHGYEILPKTIILLRNEKREELTDLDYENSGRFDLTVRIIFKVHSN